MSRMFERLKRLYESGQIHEDELLNAVDYGWITEEEMAEIMGENYSIPEQEEITEE